ncbi:MAG: PAS domain S-box protein [Promethearchaeia archaeon]
MSRKNRTNQMNSIPAGNEKSYGDRYFTLLNSLSDAVFIHDFEGRFIEVNTEATRRLGYSREELLEMGPEDIDAPEFTPLIKTQIQEIRDEGNSVFETAHITKEGERIPVELSSTVAKYNGDDVIISIARDISKRKQVERALEESQERLSFVIQGAALGTWDWNVETDEIVFNEIWANMLGYDLSEIESNLKAWKKRVHPDDLPRVMDTLNRHLEGNTEYYASEHRMKSKDGDWIWIEDRGKVVERNEAGEPLRATGIHLNINERKKAQQDLQKEREQLLEIFNSIDEIIYVSDPKTHEVLFVNEYMKEIFGHDLEGGICYEEFQGFSEPCDFCTTPIITKNPDEPYQWEYHNPLLDVDLLITDTTIRWPDDRRVRFEIAIDITDQKRVEQNLKESKRELELYHSLLKHDLSNDVHLLINLLDYVAILENPEQMKKQCAQVRAVTKRMQKLLHLFKDYDTTERAGLIETIETSITQSENINPELDVSLSLDGNEDEMNCKMGGLLGLVFDNLLRNSAQHAGSDTQVRIGVSEDQDDMFVSFSDNGPGIPESVQPRLFDRELSATGGMGLYLSRRIVEAYGGVLKLIESGSDGTTFRIRLPKILNNE